jgi:hypothetical protein
MQSRAHDDEARSSGGATTVSRNPAKNGKNGEKRP